MTLLLTPNNLLHILLSAFSLFLLHLLVKFTRRVYFHRLSHVPGPRLAAATFQYEAFHDVVRDGQFNWRLAELHDAYGPVVRCSPEEVHVRDSGFFEVLHPTSTGQTGAGGTRGGGGGGGGGGGAGEAGGRAGTRERWERANRANNAPGSVASALGHEMHRGRRAALNPYFSRQAVGRLEGKSIRDKVELLCERLRDEGGGGWVKAEEEGAGGDNRRRCRRTRGYVEIGAAVTALTLDVISEYCYDDCMDCLREPDFAVRWKRAMTDIFEPVSVLKHFPVVGRLMMGLPKGLVERMSPAMGMFVKCREELTAQAETIWKEYFGSGGGQKEEEEETTKKGMKDKDQRPRTVYHGILQTDLPAAEKTLDRLTDEAFVLLTAGAETTARVLTTTITHLALNPGILEELRRELAPVMDAAGPAGTLPDSHTLENIPLLKAVVQEGIRIANAVTNRQILIAPYEDLVCQGVRIPRGTPTSQTYSDVLFDPEIFDEPRKFKPGRWLEGVFDEAKTTTAAAAATRLDKYLVAFSRGSRSCVGMWLAYTELYLTLAALCWRFEWELHEGFDKARDLDVTRDKFIGLPSPEAKPILVSLESRI